MALKTQGFALSALPTSPRVPENIGVLDMKAISDGVRRGLETFETVRRAPQSMILADAQMAAETAKQPLATRHILAETEGIEQQTPLKTAILAAEASPEFLEARKRHLMQSLDPSGVREFERLTAGMSPEEKEKARRIRFGIDPRISSAAIGYKTVVGSDGVERLVAVDPRSVGAQVIPAPTAAGSETSTTPATTAPTTPASVINPFQSPTLKDRKFQEASGAKSAEVIQEAKGKLPKARTSLESLESKTDRVEKDIAEAAKLASGWTTGFGAILKNLPATDARKLDALLTAIKANIGFDALTDMRLNSPTGGALGNVSDYEGKTLQSTIAALDQALESGDLKEALLKVKEARREALIRTRNAYERDLDAYGVEAGSPSSSTATPTTSSGEYKIVEIK